MPIDPIRAVGATLDPWRSRWDADDVLLYHLGLGAGLLGGDGPDELRWIYERDLRVLPSFGVAPAFAAVPRVNDFDGVDVDWSLVLHGSQHLVVHRPLPAAAAVEHRARVAAVWDKGKAAVVDIEVVTSDTDGPLCTNRFGLFARGAGGFGGPGGDPPAEHAPPDRAPDAVLASPTAPNQALLYRLSGDRNPLHVDPGAARAAGFDTPLLHGLCSFGIACKAVVDTLLDGDPDRVAAFEARFAGVVFPGEAIETAMWHTREQIVLRSTVADRGTPVLTHAALTVR